MAAVSSVSEVRQFNTLAQSGTTREKKPSSGKAKLVSGLGADATDKKTLNSRAKRKLVTNILSLELKKIAEEEGNAKLKKIFRNAYYCLDTVKVAYGRVYGDYCKTRCCTVCSAIRKAEIINKYYSILKTWPDPHFVTITVSAVEAVDLRRLFLNMKKGWNRIHQIGKKRHQRGKAEKFMGVKSFESNFNPKKRTYNPHLHIIVPSKEIGDFIIQQWLAQPIKKGLKRKWITAEHQDIRRIDNLEKCLIEVIKYGSKILTEPDVYKKTKGVGEKRIYVRALYNIFKAFDGHRIFDRFGFNLPSQARQTKISVITDFRHYKYDIKRKDWIDENGEPLVRYIPEPTLSFLLENRIDNRLF